MTSFVTRQKVSRIDRAGPPGYTLVEILVATTLTLVMMTGVASLFGTMAKSITDSRSTLEMSDRLRTAQLRLQEDLAGLTVVLDPPRGPSSSEGYLQITEGPIGPIVSPADVAVNLDNGGKDTSFGDTDDLLLFTTRTTSDPFVGRILIKRWPQPGETPDGMDDVDNDGSVDDPYVLVRAATSADAEVAWFVRGNMLCRRVLLVLPQFDADARTITNPGAAPEMQLDSRPQSAGNTNPTYAVFGPTAVFGPAALNIPPGPGFYNDYDVSVRFEMPDQLLPNSFADLTKPENRFAHSIQHGFPYHPRAVVGWGAYLPPLGLPTLAECSYRFPRFSDDGMDPINSWNAGRQLPVIPEPSTPGLTATRAAFDPWRNPFHWDQLHPVIGKLSLPPLPTAVSGTPERYHGERASEDVILTNVLAFDVKVWDPGAPVMMDVAPGGAQLIYAPGDPDYLTKVNAYTAAAPQNASTLPRPISYGAYVDLNYMCLLGPAPAPNQAMPRYQDDLKPTNIPDPQFNGAGNASSGLRGTDPSTSPSNIRSAVYDTWSTHYEHDGIGNDWYGNGLDDNGDGIVDDVLEMDALPPYPTRLQGIQVKIRVFDPDSRQVRELTVTH